MDTKRIAKLARRLAYYNNALIYVDHQAAPLTVQLQGSNTLQVPGIKTQVRAHLMAEVSNLETELKQLTGVTDD